MNTYLKFKEREETKGIRLHYVLADIPMKDYERIVMRKGWFSIGYNLVLHADGTMEEGIPLEQCSDPFVEGWDDHICVLVMGQTQGKMSQEQAIALEALKEHLQLPIIY